MAVALSFACGLFVFVYLLFVFWLLFCVCLLFAWFCLFDVSLCPVFSVVLPFVFLLFLLPPCSYFAFVVSRFLLALWCVCVCVLFSFSFSFFLHLVSSGCVCFGEQSVCFVRGHPGFVFLLFGFWFVLCQWVVCSGGTS